MSFWTVFGSIGSAIGSLFSAVAIAITIIIYRKTTRESQIIQDNSLELEKIRATLRDFPQLKRSKESMELEIRELDERDKILYFKSYLGQLEQFAVGVNLDAYSLDVVNQMSGGMLINQYKLYFKDFIYTRRYGISHEVVNPENIYCEYEKMIKGLFEKRGIEWESVSK